MEHTGEHALAGHDALAHFLKDRAAGVALLADLRELEHNIVAAKLRADRQRPEIIALDDEVFAEGAVDDLGAARAEGLDLLMAQQRDLPMPLSGVGIVFDAPVLNKLCGADVLLFGSLLLADADSKYLSHIR